MSTINDSDLLLVERNGNLHQITYDQMSTLNDDDILLVERGGVQYKVEAQYISTGPNGLIVPPVEVLTPINGAGITEFDQYEPLSSAITTVGGAGTIAKDTDEIQSVVSLATGAANLDRDNNSWINITNGVSIGTSEFTFECFFYVDSFNDWGTIFDTRENYATDNNQIYLGTDSQNRVYFWAVDGSGNYTHRYEKSINTGQWYHLALVRDSNNLMHLYVDGAHATKNSGDYYHSGSINPLTRLGQTQLDGPYDDFVNNLNFEFDGKLSNVRVTVGQALYTSDFTVPPTPLTTTSQNATASNVKLLCCQSTTDVTAAAVSPGSLVANGHAVATSGPGGSDVLLSFPTNTNFSGLSVGDDVSGVNSGSLYLDGDAVIKISSDNDAASIFNIQGHEAFSIEAWVYPTSLGTYNNIMSGWDDNCSHYGVLFHIDGSGQIFFGGLGGATHTSNASNPVTLNNWHHVAVTRNNGGDGEFFIDGVSAGTFNNNNPANSHTCGVFIGANMDGYADGSGGYADYRWHGYISNLRYVVGHQTYTSNFTPSTEPLTPTSQNVPISNCRFLACQDATSFDTNIRPTWNGTSWSLDEVPMTADYGTPVASEQHPWSIEITAIDASATPPTITVDGGTWDTSNQSEVWSSSSNISGTLFEPAYPMSKAFNGVLTFNNNAFAQMNNTATLTFPGGPISFTTLRVYAQKYATSSTATFFVNGTDYTSQLGGSGNTSLGWYTITGETELTSIGLGSYNGASDATALYAVEVDGKILVDAVEDSQSWGDYITISEGLEGNYNTDTTNMFDGNTSTATSLYSGNSRPTTVVLTPPSPITVTSGLRVWMAVDRGQSISVNGSQTNASVSAGWNNTSFTGTLTTLTIGPANAGSSSNIGAIEIDGKLMLTPGVRGIGDRKLTSSTPYEKSLTFTDATELANMVAPLEMADATGSNALTPTTSNVVSTSFTPSASFFNTTAYTGNNSVNVQNFTTKVDIQNNGGMIWFKSRTSGQAARILDTYGGTLSSLIPSSTAARNNLGADGLTINDDGFSIGWAGGDLASSNDYVAWSFREAPGFFDMVTWTGDGSSNRQISHNLGTVPGMILVKMTSTSDSWQVYHKGTGETHYLMLNNTNSAIDNDSRWNDTAPTDSVFTIGNDNGVNQAGQNFVAYLFADNPSTQIKCGSYLGNAVGGGSPVVPNQIECGFKPKFVLIKNVENSTDWLIFDDQRGDRWLKANEPDSEGFSSDAPVVFNDTGFSLPTGLHWVNHDNVEHIYLAIGEAGTPDTTELTFQDNTALSALTSGMTITSDRVPTLGSAFSTDLYTGNSSSQSITTGIDVAGEGGLVWIKNRSSGYEGSLFDTERGAGMYMISNGAQGEVENTTRLSAFNSDGFSVGDDPITNSSGQNFVSWSFRKAAGFFDVVTWEGSNDANRQIAHNLGSVPGFIIIKRYNGTEDWTCYHKSLGANGWIQLNATDTSYTGSWFMNNTEPTSTHFSVGSHGRVNTAGYNYVAYLFADNPSNEIKCGTYTGTGPGMSVDVGFRPHWVMLKSSSHGSTNWVIADSSRSNEVLWPNSADAAFPHSVSFTDTGFTLDSNSSYMNLSGYTYIYIAIGSPTGMSSVPTGTLTVDADPSTNTASVAATSWPTGDTVTGPSLGASLTSILEVSGNTIFGNGSTGSWISGYYAEGSEINAAPPGPSEITFTSQNQGTPAFSGVDATLASRTWTLESGTTATGPWTVVDSYVDYDVLNSQDGSTPWISNKPTLQPNTYYRIKVQYNSTNAESVESVYHTFKTGDA